MADGEPFTPSRAGIEFPDVFGPGQNRFWRKSAVETDADFVFDSRVSMVYGDLFDGTSTTAVISGGADNSFYLSDFNIANTFARLYDTSKNFRNNNFCFNYNSNLSYI